MISKDLFKKRINMVKDFVRYLKKYKKYFLAIVLLNLFVTAISIATPYLYKILLDDVIIRKEYGLLKWIILAYIAFFCVETFFLLIIRIINNYLYNDLMFSIRADIWNKLGRMSFSDFEEYQHADLKQRIDSDVDCVEVLVNQQSIEYVFLWIYVSIVGILLLKIHLLLGVASFIVIPIGNWISGLTAKGIRQSSDDIRGIWGQYESYLQNSIQGWKDIKVLNAEKRVMKKFTRFWHAFAKSFFRMQLYILGNRSLQTIKDIILARMSIYFVGAIFIMNGELTVGSLLVFGNYFDIFNGKLNNIISSDNHFNSIIPSIDRVKGIINKEEKGKFRRDTGAFENSHDFTGAIELSNICFRYGTSSIMVLNNVNAKIEAKECVAIAGRSGCGKSTFIKLILGLYEPCNGEITISGQNISLMDPSYLNNKIGIVMQDSILFDLSIKENLLFAEPTASDEDMEEACKQAFASEFISKLPEGLDTVIGEKGSLLSGGQRQRIAIARALLKKPEIMIFDEASSALDYESEKMINKAIDNISKDRTVIIIAHRLSAIQLANKVIVIDNGRVEAIGTHNELYKNCETYISLFKEQYSLSSLI